jgi:putative addiction module CopG family antidote
MDVELTADQRAFIRRAIESGRFRREEDVVQEALKYWEERERRRAEMLAAVDDAERSLSRGEGTVLTQHSVDQLSRAVKERGRKRLTTERSSS